jgi:hypothetical protein
MGISLRFVRYRGILFDEDIRATDLVYVNVSGREWLRRAILDASHNPRFATQRGRITSEIGTKRTSKFYRSMSASAVIADASSSHFMSTRPGAKTRFALLPGHDE